MVDDKIDRNQRIDLFRITAERLEAIAHSCKVNNGWNAGEVLHQHAGRAVSNFCTCRSAICEPCGNSFDIRLLDGAVIFKAKQVLKQNLHGKWKLGNARQAVLFGFGQAVIDIVLTVDGKRFAAFETINVRHFSSSSCCWPENQDERLG